MSDRVEPIQVTEYIVDGYIRSIHESVINEISKLCKSYIGHHFNAYRDEFEWIFECSNLRISKSNDNDYSSDSEDEAEFKSPEYEIFGGKFTLNLLKYSSEIFITASFEDLPSEWVSCYIQLKIKCIETCFQNTELLRIESSDHESNRVKITNNSEKYKQQLTFMIDITNIRCQNFSA